MSKRIRTRFAPSPTGPLHMGGVRTALYCYAFAKKHDGDLVLRIEDTDQNRYVAGAEEYIIESLKWAGIEPNEGVGFEDKGYGPYRQSERKGMYRQYAEQLVESGHAYYAFDTPEELEKMRKDMKAQGNPSPKYDAITRQYMKNSVSLPQDEVSKRLESGEDYVIRIKMPRNEEVKFEDAIRGWVSFQTAQLDDKVLLKADGMPTYHMANVVDDHLMAITHVIRGEEWLSSTPLHVLLHRYLGWEEDMPNFAHLPLILKPDGNGKLSKRDGDRLGFPVFPLDWTNPETGEKSSGYRERGFFPEAFANFMMLLGWNPGTEQELFSLEEFCKIFSLERVGKSGAKFDFEKAKWFNQQYLKDMDSAQLVDLVIPYLQEAGYPTSDKNFLLGFVDLVKERCVFLNEFPEAGYYFFEPVRSYDEKTVRKKWKPENQSLFEELRDRLMNLTHFNGEEIEQEVKAFMADHELGFGQVLPILRVGVTGTMQGPPIFDVMALLGKEEIESRLNRAFKEFNG